MAVLDPQFICKRCPKEAQSRSPLAQLTPQSRDPQTQSPHRPHLHLSLSQWGQLLQFR